MRRTSTEIAIVAGGGMCDVVALVDLTCLKRFRSWESTARSCGERNVSSDRVSDVALPFDDSGSGVACGGAVAYVSHISETCCANRRNRSATASTQASMSCGATRASCRYRPTHLKIAIEVGVNVREPAQSMSSSVSSRLSLGSKPPSNLATSVAFWCRCSKIFETSASNALSVGQNASSCTFDGLQLALPSSTARIFLAEIVVASLSSSSSSARVHKSESRIS
mmetsp:Transcript_16229/g.35194  ORF Transcript_16229/g.35194 Transcript_16229/m.35194 type:complete len:224 (+) Transcript_16229:1-672(+)